MTTATRETVTYEEIEARIRELDAEQAGLCTRLSRINARLDAVRRDIRASGLHGTAEQRAALAEAEGERTAVSGMLEQVQADLRLMHGDRDTAAQVIHRRTREARVRSVAETRRVLESTRQAVRVKLADALGAILTHEAARELHHEAIVPARAAARELAELGGLPAAAPQRGHEEAAAFGAVLASLGLGADALDLTTPPTWPPLPRPPFPDLAVVRADFTARLERVQ